MAGVCVYFDCMRFLSGLAFVLVLTACGNHVPAPITVYGTSQGPGSSGVHNVARGETLWTISQRYNIVMRDIVSENGLSAPFELNVGQRLILPPPREYQVRRGDSVSEIARLFDVSASEIVRINDLRSPYRLNVGQVLRLPSGEVPAVQPRAVAETRVAAGVPSRVVRVEPNRAARQDRSMNDVVDGIIGDEPQSVTAQQRAASGDVVTPPRKPDIKAAKSSAPKRKKRVVTPKRGSSKFLKPLEGKTLSGYGPKADGLHNDGINIAAARGTAVRAADNGVVVYAGNGLKGSGNLILVRHEDRWMTAYGHLDQIKVANGDIVRRGGQIGTVGSTGAVKTPQLHFEVRRGTKALNPKPYLE